MKSFNIFIMQNSEIKRENERQCDGIYKDEIAQLDTLLSLMRRFAVMYDKTLGAVPATSSGSHSCIKMWNRIHVLTFTSLVRKLIPKMDIASDNIIVYAVNWKRKLNTISNSTWILWTGMSEVKSIFLYSSRQNCTRGLEQLLNRQEWHIWCRNSSNSSCMYKLCWPCML